MLFFGGGLIGLAVMALWIFCIFDVIATDESLARSLPKGLWLLLVIFLPMIGSVAWLALGRPLYAGWRPGDTTTRPPRRVLGPEDRADFPTQSAAPRRPTPPSPPPADEKARLEEWEADLRRREEELRKQTDDDEPS